MGEPEQDEPDLSGRRILVVDDNGQALDALARTLRAWGGEVVEAAGSSEARGILAEQADKLDVVFMDQFPGDTTGLEAMVGASNFTGRLVLMTPMSLTEAERKLAGTLVATVVLKPLGFGELRELVREL